MWEGLAAALSPFNVLLALAGVVSGTVIGALPGLTATMAVAVLVPLTFAMEPAAALILMGAIYTGAIYGGAYPAILLNTPGTPSAVATTFDGYPMAKRGDGDLAVTVSCLASVCGGLAGALALLFLSPPLAEWALAFGSVEYFWLAVLGLSLVSALSRRDFLKGLSGACAGMLLSAVGVAEISADVRLTFGSQTLVGGIDIVSALIGLYCIPVLMDLAAARENHLKPSPQRGYRLAEAWRITVRGKWNILRSSVIGTVVGILPGAGGSIAGLVAYSEARRNNKRGQFGQGEPAGVQACESANNATVGGGLIPTLVLGIPGTPPDAVILGALLIQGLRTGPELFAGGGPVYTFAWGLVLATLLMLPCGLFIGRRAHRFVADVPKTVLVPLIGFLTLIGSFSIRNSAADSALMVALGVCGWGVARLGFAPSPIVLGLILGGIAEQGFVQAWTIGSAADNLSGVFFGRPLSQLILVFILAAFLYPLWQMRRQPRRREKSKTTAVEFGAAAGGLALAGLAVWDANSYTDRDSVVFPVAVAAALAVFSAAAAARAAAGFTPAPENNAGGVVWRRAAVAGGMLAAALLAPFAGFFIASLLAVFVLFAAAMHVRPRQIVRQAAVLLAAVAGLYFLFLRGFQVPLPAGAWFA